MLKVIVLYIGINGFSAPLHQHEVIASIKPIDCSILVWASDPKHIKSGHLPVQLAVAANSKVFYQLINVCGFLP
jgi:hypothetical protein